MNLIYNQTYTFSYVETFLSKNGRTLFRVSLDGELYNVVARKYQVNNPPKEFVCRVKDIEENGYVRLTQEIPFILRDYYKPGAIYVFKVIGETPSVSGLPCYTLYNEDTELEHKYFGRDETDVLEVGQTIQRQTKVKEDKYGIPRLFFYQEDDDFTLFSPERVFTEIPHGDFFDTYFNDFVPETNELLVIYDEMIEKIETENRLWIFDYLKLLTHWSYVHPLENIQRASDCNTLIVDIENWVQNSSLLNKFSKDTREETLVKIKTTIRKSLEALEILQSIRDGELDQLLEMILNTARDNKPESCYSAFSKLIRIIYINPDVVETNFRTIAEFILLTANRITDEDALSMILKSFKRRIWTLKKQINTSIHFQRSKELDRDQLIDLTLGHGVLLYMLSDSMATENPAIDFNTTFAEFCKYLALLSDPERANALIQKSLEFVMGIAESIEFDPILLVGIIEDPDPFIDNLLQMPIKPDDRPCGTTAGACQMQYNNGRLIILPTASRIRALQPTTVVYDIPKTVITVASGKAGATPWESDEDLSYYDRGWDELEKWGQTDTLPDQNEDVIIRVKPINTLPNYVFCSIEGPRGCGQDGAIQNKGYLPRAFVDDPNSIFESGMRFRSKFQSDSKGRISFSISDTLIEHSKQIAANSEVRSHIGVCFSIEKGRFAFFITRSGIVCAMSLALRTKQTISVDEAYILSVDSKRSILGYPSAYPLDYATCEETAAELLKRQLRQIAIPEEDSPAKDIFFKQMPHVLLIVDQYLRLASDDRTRYNLYRAMSLIASAEGSQLVEYYRSRVSYLEQLSAFAAGDKINDDLDKPDITSRFPSLKEQEENLTILSAFGVEDDLDYLFNAAKRTDCNPNATKLARLVLASNLIIQNDGPDDLLDGLRKFIVSELGATSFIGSADDVMDYEEPEQEQEGKSVSFFGAENQTQEFKTSIVFNPETSIPDFDNQISTIMKTICGFLNAKGGVLWIGVNDSGFAHGIAADLKELNCSLDKYERILRQNIVNLFGKDVNGTISFEFVKDGEFDICKITIPSYPRPIAIHNEFFQRQGNETRIIKGNDLVLFVERKMLEKQPVSTTNEKPQFEQPSDEAQLSSTIQDSIPSQEVSPDSSLTLSVWLNTFIDGTFVLSNSRSEDRRILYSVALPEEGCAEYSLLLCYDDGTVNRVPVSSIVNKKRNYYYNNGVFKGASFMNAFLVKNQQFIICSSHLSETPIACRHVCDLPAQTMLGMKGVPVSQTDNGQIIWSVSSKINEPQAVPQELDVKVPTDPISTHDRLLLGIPMGRQTELREWLENLNEKEFQEVRKTVSEIYTACNFDADSFWPLTITLLEGNAKLLRKPIADAVKTYSDCQKLACTSEEMNHVVELLLSDSDKIHQGMDFLIPFKSMLTKEAKEILVSKAKYINTPEGFHTLFFLIGASFQEKLNVFEQLVNNLAAQFVTYEVLLNDEEENGIWHIQSAENLNAILEEMQQSYGGRILYNLIRYFVFHENADISDKEAEELAAGGFEGIVRLVAQKESQNRESLVISEMPSFVGEELNFTVNKVYKNHYFVLHPKYRALLPLRFAIQSYQEGDELNAVVVKSYPRNKLFLVTQRSASAKQLEAIPIVNIGDIVEVRFGISTTSGVVVPTVQGYPLLRAEIVDYPRDFDYKKRYFAEVVTTRFTVCKLSLKEAIV